MKDLIFVLQFAFLIGGINAQGVLFTFEDGTFEPGNNVQMRCKTYGFDSIASFQFGVLFDTAGLKLDSVKVSGVLPDYSTDYNFSWKEISQATTIKPGSLYTLWTDPYGKTLEDGSILFTAYFTAKTVGALSQSVVNYPEGMTFEAIQYPFTFIPIDVVFVSSVAGGAFTPLGDIEAPMLVPNPFSESFSLNRSGTLLLYDVFGRLVHSSQYVAGTQVASEIKSGIYFGRIGNQSFKIQKQ